MKIKIAVLCIALCTMLTGCNLQPVDTTWSYERAFIKLPNGECVEGKVESWKDFENSDQLQVKVNDKTYLTHSTNVVMISE